MKYVTKITPTSDESAHQSRFFEVCALNQKLHPVLGSKLLFAVINENKVRGGVAGAIVGNKLKAMGKKAGVADVICLCPLYRIDGFGSNESLHNYHALCLEFKKPGGTQKPDQKLFQKQAEESGYCYQVVYGWLEGVKALGDYLGINIPILED